MSSSSPTQAHVYIFAFACEPGRGSEPGVGYLFVQAAAQLAKSGGRRVTVVTRPHRVQFIRETLEAEGIANYVELLQVPVPRILVRVTQRRRVRYAYLWWQAVAVSLVQALIKAREEPAIVHHVTFATESIPTFEWRLNAFAARVFGPAGSGSANETKSRFGRLLTLLKQELGRFNLQGVDLAIAQNSYAMTRWEPFGTQMILEPNIALSDDMPIFIGPKDGRQLVTTGVLTAVKQQHLSIHALSKLPEEYRLTIVGGGPLKAQLTELADDLGVSHRVTFTGQLPRDQALKEIARADMLIHTSRSEGSAWVVGEAQALGVYPVVLRGSGADGIIEIGGFGIVVDGIDGIVQAVVDRVPGNSEPTDRWDRARLRDLLDDWYRSLDIVAWARFQRSRSQPT